MPDPSGRRVLITGATGYIGRRLTRRLLDRNDLRLRLLVRNRQKVQPSVLDKVEVFEGDTFHPETLGPALEGVDTALYLIHSMGGGKGYEERDRQSAQTFRDGCISAGVGTIIYLGGLGEKKTASRHLLSRIETGEILSSRPREIRTIWFRAGVIIGSGSASFEIIRHLVQKLPVMITPRWVHTRTQPVGVDDVLAYLEAAINLETGENQVIDIGSHTMTFKDMMVEAAQAMGLKRLIFGVPVLSPRLSSYWLILFTPVPFQLARALIEGLRSETVMLNDHASRFFPGIRPMPFTQAVSRAITEMEHDQVVSRWCDSSGGGVCDIRDQTDTSSAILRDRREFPLDGLPTSAVFRAVCCLGGEKGWYSYHLLWQIRGLIDKLAGGYGLNRGRRECLRLRPGDALDFWKVVDVRENRRVLLLAQMKLPGRAWLEFDITPDRLIQTAHFHPRGLAGRLYWWAVFPFHSLVFAGLGRKILQEAISAGITGTKN